MSEKETITEQLVELHVRANTVNRVLPYLEYLHTVPPDSCTNLSNRFRYIFLLCTDISKNSSLQNSIGDTRRISSFCGGAFVVPSVLVWLDVDCKAL
jgi:hypothetical protein